MDFDQTPSQLKFVRGALICRFMQVIEWQLLSDLSTGSGSGLGSV